MFDATPIQCIAHGTVTAVVTDGPAPFSGEGVESVVRISQGLTPFTLTLGTPGGGAVPTQDSRILIPPLDTLPALNYMVHKHPNQMQFDVQFWVTNTKPVDTSFDFVIFRSAV